MNSNVAQSCRNINGPVKQSVAIIIITEHGVPTTPEMSKGEKIGICDHKEIHTTRREAVFLVGLPG
jgi:hypothetical protein